MSFFFVGRVKAIMATRGKTFREIEQEVRQSLLRGGGVTLKQIRESPDRIVPTGGDERGGNALLEEIARLKEENDALVSLNKALENEVTELSTLSNDMLEFIRKEKPKLVGGGLAADAMERIIGQSQRHRDVASAALGAVKDTLNALTRNDGFQELSRVIEKHVSKMPMRGGTAPRRPCSPPPPIVFQQQPWSALKGCTALTRPSPTFSETRWRRRGRETRKGRTPRVSCSRCGSGR